MNRMNKVLISIGFALWFLIVGAGLVSIANAQETDAAFYYSDDDCFHPVMGWEGELMAADGHDYLQLRYYNQTTGITVYDGEPGSMISVLENDVTIGTCGLGLWSFQIRLSNADSLGGWDRWQIITMVNIEEYISSQPNAPTFFVKTQDGAGSWRDLSD